MLISNWKKKKVKSNYDAGLAIGAGGNNARIGHWQRRKSQQ
jgi:hypothetical protein